MVRAQCTDLVPMESWRTTNTVGRTRKSMHGSLDLCPIFQNPGSRGRQFTKIHDLLNVMACLHKPCGTVSGHALSTRSWTTNKSNALSDTFLLLFGKRNRQTLRWMLHIFLRKAAIRPICRKWKEAFLRFTNSRLLLTVLE